MGYIDSLSEKIIHKLLCKLEYGKITLVADGISHHFYGSRNQHTGCVTITIHDKKFFSTMLLTGTKRCG